MANGRCEMHGGKSPSGIASGTFKHGKYSKYLPTGLKDTYNAAINDKELLSLRNEIALTDAYISTLLEKSPDMAPDELQEALMPQIEQRRKLVDSEAKRLKDLQATVTIEGAMGIIKLLAEIVNRIVTDPKQRQQIATELHAAISR